MDAAELSPVPEAARTQPPLDLFLIFVAANVVATTMQTGAALGSRYSGSAAIGIAMAGAVFGAALVAVLAPVGSRTGLPSMIAARAALGYRGAQIVSGLLYLSNFAWIAVNNQIAASAVAQVAGGPDSARIWAAVLGIAATVVVARGPRAVGHADRIAVPMMAIAGGVLTYAAFTHAATAEAVALQTPVEGPSVWWGLDVVIGYQVSWLLMFADYSRYTRSPRAAGTAVFAGLALPALWLLPVGWTLSRLAGSDDPGAMLAAAGVGWWTAALVALASVTTNFVNIYLSSLAWRTLVPSTTGTGSVWTIGLLGTALGLISTGWLTQFADLDGAARIGAGPGWRRVHRALRGTEAAHPCRPDLRHRGAAGLQRARHARVAGRLPRLQSGCPDWGDAAGAGGVDARLHCAQKTPARFSRLVALKFTRASKRCCRLIGKSVAKASVWNTVNASSGVI